MLLFSFSHTPYIPHISHITHIYYMVPNFCKCSFLHLLKFQSVNISFGRCVVFEDALIIGYT